jgi:outer membrane protein OmpA-like peptidoglycan-associated protein
MRLESNRINSNNPFLLFAVNARLNTSGKLKGTLKVDPKHYKDIDIDASIKELLITDFNPYSKYYVATPFLNGTISYVNRTTVLGGKLDSKNVLDIQQIKAGKKVKNSTAMNLPVRLAVSLLKDVKGNVHLDIPVKGSLDDPKFKWGKVIWQVIKNLIVKAATAPFRLLANMFGGKEEDFKEMQFEYAQTEIQPNQQTILDRLAKVAAGKPDLKIDLIQVTNLQDDMEAIAVYAIKKNYLGIGDMVSNVVAKQRTDSITNNDSLFVQYINAQLRTSSAIQSTEEKCIQLMGKEKLGLMVQEQMRKRNEAVRSYLIDQKKITDASLQISNTKELNQLQKSSPPKYVINVAIKE